MDIGIMEPLYLYLLLIDFQGVLGLNTRFLGFIIAIVQRVALVIIDHACHPRILLPLPGPNSKFGVPDGPIWVEKSIIIKEY